MLLGYPQGSSWVYLSIIGGIDLDPTNTKAIATLSPSTTLKELRSFVKKVSYLRRFISSLVEILKPLVEQTKKGVTFIWCD